MFFLSISAFFSFFQADVPNSRTPMAAYQFKEISIEKPLHWDVDKKDAGPDTHVIVFDPTKSHMLLVDLVTKEEDPSVPAESIAKNLGEQFSKQKEISANQVVMEKSEAFFRLKGSSALMSKEMGLITMDARIKVILIEKDRYVVMTSVSIRDTPEEADLKRIIPTIKINGKSLR